MSARVTEYVEKGDWKNVNDLLERMDEDRRVVFIPMLFKKLTIWTYRNQQSKILQCIYHTVFARSGKDLVVNDYLNVLLRLLKLNDTMLSAAKVLKIVSGRSNVDVCDKLAVIFKDLKEIIIHTRNYDIQYEVFRILQFCCKLSQKCRKEFIDLNLIEVSFKLLNIKKPNQDTICTTLGVILYLQPDEEINLTEEVLQNLLNLINSKDEEVVAAAVNLLRIVCYQHIPDILSDLVDAEQLVSLLDSRNQEIRLRAIQLIEKLLDIEGLRTEFIECNVVPKLINSLEATRTGRYIADAIIKLDKLGQPDLRKSLFMSKAAISINEMLSSSDPEIRNSAQNVKLIIDPCLVAGVSVICRSSNLPTTNPKLSILP